MFSFRGSILPTHRIKSVAIFRALQLGDMLCAVPAIRAFRNAIPDGTFTLVGLPWAREFVRRFPNLFDAFVEFPGYPGLPERVADTKVFPDFVSDMKSRRFDLAVQLHGSGPIVNPIVSAFEARYVAGFFRDQCDKPSTGAFVRFPETGHEIERLLHLPTELGLLSDGTDLEFPVGTQDREEAARLMNENDLKTKRFVCVHAGARLRSRRWSAKNFAQVADRIRQMGLSIALTGSAAECDVVDAVQNQMSTDAINLCGETSVGALAVLLKHSVGLISNDTGVSHIASALKVPSVVVCLGSDPKRWAPLNHDRHRTVYAEVACRPCAYDECPIEHACAVPVLPEQIVREFVNLLATESIAVGGVS